MEEELENQYPIGSIIYVALNYRQKNYSSVKVIGHNGDGYVRIIIADPKNTKRIRGINVHYTNIKKSINGKINLQGKTKCME